MINHHGATNTISDVRMFTEIMKLPRGPVQSMNEPLKILGASSQTYGYLMFVLEL